MFTDDRAELGDAPLESDTALRRSSWTPAIGLDLDRALRPFGQPARPRARMLVPVRVTNDALGSAPFPPPGCAGRRSLRHLPHDADGADLAQIVWFGLVVSLCESRARRYGPCQGPFDGLDRHRAIDGERLHRQREGHGPPQRQDGQFRWKLGSGVGHRGRVGSRGARARARARAVQAARSLAQSKASAHSPDRVVLPVYSVWYASRVDERQFFTEKPEQRPARIQCPRCRRTNDYSIKWLRRTEESPDPFRVPTSTTACSSASRKTIWTASTTTSSEDVRQPLEIPSHRRSSFWKNLRSSPGSRRRIAIAA